jgi:beta-glucanase (GH16 family)
MRRGSHPSRHSVALVLAGLAFASLASSCSQPPQWSLVWQDEFEGSAGDPPNPAFWTHDVGGGGWGNAQLEFDTARPENSSLDGLGHLVITARSEQYQGRSYTSARILTKGLFEQSLGRWEARICLPQSAGGPGAGRGIWPAFWLLGANYDSVGWPACGEIDIVEQRGQEPSVVRGSLHAPGYFGGDAITAPFVFPAPPSCPTPPCTPCSSDADFHVYAVEVEASQITFEVDGAMYQRVRLDQLPTGSAWPFNRPFFILLNVAVGGSYVGAPDVSTVFPQTMLVDYVRYYRLQ